MTCLKRAPIEEATPGVKICDEELCFYRNVTTNHATEALTDSESCLLELRPLTEKNDTGYTAKGKIWVGDHYEEREFALTTEQWDLLARNVIAAVSLREDGNVNLERKQ